MSNASLLPPNSTPFERAAATANAALGDIDVPIAALWTPQDCPAHVLPWLAWAYSVDEWDTTWTEQQKRNAIDAAVYIHRHKGTVAAVTRAVNAVLDDAEVEEWFAYGGEPFHFRIVSEGRFTGEADYRRLIRLVESAKNARSWLEAVVVRSRIEMPLYHGSVIAQGNRLSLGPRPAVPALASATLRTGQAYHVARTTTVRALEIRISVETTQRYRRGALHESRKLTIRG